MPVRDVFAVKRGSARASDLVFYAESWAIVDWMLRANRNAFDAFLGDISGGVPAEEALRKHYRRDVGFLDAIIHSYVPSQYPITLTVGPRAGVTSVEKIT